MSVFGVMYKMGYFRENLHTKQKTSRKNPSTAYGGSPPFSREAFYSGSPLGELAPQVTEGLVRRPFTLSKRFHKNPSTSYAGPPPLSGEAIFQRGHGAICRYDVKTIYERIPPPPAAVPLPFQGRLVILGSLEKGAGSRRLTEGFYCET